MRSITKRAARAASALAVLSAAGLLISCGSGGTAPPVADTAVAALYVSARDTVLQVNQSTSARVVAVTRNGDTVPPPTVTWSVSDSFAASVDAGGNVLARSVGVDTLTATAADVSGSLALTITYPAIASMVVTPDSAPIFPGNLAQFSVIARDVQGEPVPTHAPATWSISNATVATVSSDGLVTGRDTGRATVTATVGSLQASAAVIVILPYTVAGVAVDPTAIGLLAQYEGATVSAVPFDASGAPLPYAPVSWTSRDDGVVTVFQDSPTSQPAYVAAQSAGEAYVVASSGPFSDSTHVLVGACDTTQDVAINHFYLPIEAGGQWNDSPVAPSGLYRTNPTLNNSGVAFGTSGARLALGTNLTGTWDVGDIAHYAVCSYQTAAVHRSLVDLTVAPGVGLDSLDVVQETWAVPDATSPSASYVLFRYTFTNEGSQPLPGFYAAYLADWDIQDLNGFADPAHNLVRYDSTLGVGEATGADTVNYPRVFGIVPVAASGAMNFRGWENGTGALGDPQTDADIFAYLSAGIDTTVPSTATDIRELMGVGPVTIPAGGRYVVYFGVLGADDQTQFDQAVAAVRLKAQTLGF